MDIMSINKESSECPSQSGCNEGSTLSSSTTDLSQPHTSIDQNASASSTSNKSASSKSTVASLEKGSASSINVSTGKLPARRPTSRVVQSRFKAAAAAVSKETSTEGSNSSGSGSGKSRLNITLASDSILPGKKFAPKAKSQRLATGIRAEGKSAVSNCPNAFGGKRDGQAHKTARPLRGNKGNLHSTILNATISDIPSHRPSSSVFSTTMVGGFAPGSRKLDITGFSLPDLPDVSALEPEGKIAESTTLSQGEKSETVEVTAEDLEQEYLSYLQWHYLDVTSDAAFTHHITQLQDLISFLEHLSSEKLEEVSEQRRVANLLLHHKRASEAHHQQMELLQSLVDSVPGSEDALTSMSRELEKSLNQVKMDNLYIPHSHKEYRDELSGALQTQLSLLSDLIKLTEPHMKNLDPINNLLTELQSTTQYIHQCEHEMQQAASLVVQEASLKIGAKQMDVPPATSQPDDPLHSLTLMPAS